MAKEEGPQLLKGYQNRDGIVDETPLHPSTIENIDLAVYEWLDKKMDIYTTTNKGWKKIPVIWIIPERARQVKHIKELRDTKGNFILPVMTLERTAVSKLLSSKGSYWSNVPPVGDYKGGSIEISRVINQEKTSNFARSYTKQATGQLHYPRENNKVVYETATIPMPVYVDMTYQVEIHTEYQQQMNEALQPFIVEPGGINRFVVIKNGWKYEAFFEESFEQENNVSNLEEEERRYITRFDIKVLGKLIGAGPNDPQPKIVVRQNIVDVKIPREKYFVGDIDEEAGKKIF